MAADSDKNWWTFSIDPAVRENRDRSRFTGEMDINPEVSAGRRDLDYRHYLGLDRLLQCQVPSSRIPDERVFIVTHQLMEIVFKLAIFDMAVLVETLETFAASEANPEALFAPSGENDEFWRPAMTASARIAFACRELLPAAMRLLSDPKDADETFNSIEFYRFRENLEPASGFQSAQFRLMQRGLGKSNLLSVRLFPSQTYQQHYGDKTDATVRVVDPVILREDATVASPPRNSPLEQAARLDDAAHAALARLAPARAHASAPEKIEPLQIHRAADLLDRILAGRVKNGQPNGSSSSPFREDLAAAAAGENERRDGLSAARAGSQWLRRNAPTSPLHRIVTRIAAADDALHGTGQDSFLSVHMRVTRERLHQIKAHVAKTGGPEPTAGTGGGGLEYLGWAQRYLIPLFPALVAYRELGD